MGWKWTTTTSMPKLLSSVRIWIRDFLMRELIYTFLNCCVPSQHMFEPLPISSPLQWGSEYSINMIKLHRTNIKIEEKWPLKKINANAILLRFLLYNYLFIPGQIKNIILLKSLDIVFDMRTNNKKPLNWTELNIFQNREDTCVFVP